MLKGSSAVLFSIVQSFLPPVRIATVVLGFKPPTLLSCTYISKMCVAAAVSWEEKLQKKIKKISRALDEGQHGAVPSHGMLTAYLLHYTLITLSVLEKCRGRWHFSTWSSLSKRKVPTCLSASSVPEDSADADQKEQQKSREGGSYRQRNRAVISFLHHLCNWEEKVTSVFWQRNAEAVLLLCNSITDLQT